MEAYRHFNLKSPPFEESLDPDRFCAIPAHAETLATLQYALHAHKVCTVVLGEAGTGKTFMARRLAETANRKGYALWVHGLGQSNEATNVIVYPPGTFNTNQVVGRLRPAHTTLAAWAQQLSACSTPTAVIVDNADSLRRRGWDDLLGLLTRADHDNEPITLVLLGLPQLEQRLASPKLVQLRRRVFRICHLPAFTAEESATYIRHHMTVAGGSSEPFTPSALAAIHRHARGNPARINAICDNALLEAFANNHQRIDEQDVAAAIQAMNGTMTFTVGEPIATPAPGGLQPLPDQPREMDLQSRLQRLTDSLGPRPRSLLITPTTLNTGPVPGQITAPTGAPPAPPPRVELGVPRPSLSSETSAFDVLTDRLHAIRARISDVLTDLHGSDAPQQQNAGAPGYPGTPAHAPVGAGSGSDV